jgi:hypothetical protein
MSARFDLEALSSEVQRLKRRHRELEQALHTANVLTAAGSDHRGMYIVCSTVHALHYCSYTLDDAVKLLCVCSCGV